MHGRSQSVLYLEVLHAGLPSFYKSLVLQKKKIPFRLELYYDDNSYSHEWDFLSAGSRASQANFHGRLLHCLLRLGSCNTLCFSQHLDALSDDSSSYVCLHGEKLREGGREGGWEREESREMRALPLSLSLRYRIIIGCSYHVFLQTHGN